MRLIDADALSKKLIQTTIFIKDGDVFQRMINDAPTVDAAEVVRCKDCKHYKKINPKAKSGMCYKDIVASVWNDDSFCSRGERKGGDDE